MSINLPKIIVRFFRFPIPPVEPLAHSLPNHGDCRGSFGFNPFLKKGKPYTAGARDREAGAKVVGVRKASLDIHRQSCDHNCSTVRRPYLATPTPQGGHGNVAPLTGGNVDMWL